MGATGGRQKPGTAPHAVPGLTLRIDAAGRAYRPAAFAQRLLKRSTRPAVSTMRCSPVKNGWQAEQTSVCRFGLVERVVNVLPQEQTTRAST